MANDATFESTASEISSIQQLNTCNWNKGLLEIFFVPESLTSEWVIAIPFTTSLLAQAVARRAACSKCTTMLLVPWTPEPNGFAEWLQVLGLTCSIPTSFTATNKTSKQELSTKNMQLPTLQHSWHNHKAASIMHVSFNQIMFVCLFACVFLDLLLQSSYHQAHGYLHTSDMQQVHDQNQAHSKHTTFITRFNESAYWNIQVANYLDQIVKLQLFAINYMQNMPHHFAACILKIMRYLIAFFHMYKCFSQVRFEVFVFGVSGSSGSLRTWYSLYIVFAL